jgi:hypothetical protein
MLVALDGRPEWLAFAAGGYYAAEPGLGARFAIPSRLQDAVAYGVPLVVVGVGALIRNELAKRAALAPVQVAPVQVAAEPVTAEPVTAEPAVAEPAAAEPVPVELEVPV